MPVVNLLRLIFERAMQLNASDIHIEPDETLLRIRLRVNGELLGKVFDEKSIASALVQRVKIMAQLNIAEKRLPQDGGFKIKISQKNINVRVSTIPIQYGESVVMRLLYQSNLKLQLDQIGMPKDIYECYAKALGFSYGLILITGPTGSGKTTTLYSSLLTLNKEATKIITIEDPIEYRLPRINQVQVHTQIGLTFATLLRAILRQDPDVIMIGELRDQETVDIAMRSAMTGHIVLSTMHTNDTISTAVRLIDMGAAGYVVSSVLRAIMAQRLVKKICSKCSAVAELTTAETVWIKAVTRSDTLDPSYIFKYGQGCRHCNNSGFSGRVGVYELLAMNDELIDALRRQDLGLFADIAKKQPTYKPLIQTGLELAINGTTTVQEVITMAGQVLD